MKVNNHAKIGIISDNKKAALALKDRLPFTDLTDKFNNKDLSNETEKFDIIVILGGDGFALHAMHKSMHICENFYGINFGNVGFLMNEYNSSKDLSKIETEVFVNDITSSIPVPLHLLDAKITDMEDKSHQLYAINEISLFRNTNQAAKIELAINGVVRMNELVCDGVLVSTPAGSTAYNFSVHGPILPFSSRLISLMPISPFRPRHWRGALLEETDVISFTIHSPDHRKVIATADFMMVTDVKKLEVKLDPKKKINLLFNPRTKIKEKIIAEQFAI